jgi:hypothetical protein
MVNLRVARSRGEGLSSNYNMFETLYCTHFLYELFLSKFLIDDFQ